MFSRQWLHHKSDFDVFSTLVIWISSGCSFYFDCLPRCWALPRMLSMWTPPLRRYLPSGRTEMHPLLTDLVLSVLLASCRIALWCLDTWQWFYCSWYVHLASNATGAGATLRGWWQQASPSLHTVQACCETPTQVTYFRRISLKIALWNWDITSYNHTAVLSW